MSDTLWRRMLVADAANWFRKVWFCRITGLHRLSFVFRPLPGNPAEHYPSYRCELCDKELFQ